MWAPPRSALLLPPPSPLPAPPAPLPQVIDLISLKPFDMETISKSIKKTRKVGRPAPAWVAGMPLDAARAAGRCAGPLQGLCFCSTAPACRPLPPALPLPSRPSVLSHTRSLPPTVTLLLLPPTLLQAIIVEECMKTGGIGASLSAVIHESLFNELDHEVRWGRCADPLLRAGWAGDGGLN